MFIAPKRKVVIKNDEFTNTVDILFKPEQDKILKQLINEFLNIKNTKQKDKEDVSVLSYLMSKENNHKEFEIFMFKFKEINDYYKK